MLHSLLYLSVTTRVLININKMKRLQHPYSRIVKKSSEYFFLSGKCYEFLLNISLECFARQECRANFEQCNYTYYTRKVVKPAEQSTIGTASARQH